MGDNRLFFPSFIILATVLLSSCASIGRDFHFSDQDPLAVGKTTMSEVRAIYGDPLREIDTKTWSFKRMHFGDEKVATVWRYGYGSGSILASSGKALEVDFDSAGKLADYIYDSTTQDDGIHAPKTKDLKDFDIFAAQEKIRNGKTTKSNVLQLLGPIKKETLVNKPGVASRWIYSFLKESGQKIKVGFGEVPEFFEKSLILDFDPQGTVIAKRGTSTFPADKDRFFTK